MDGWSIDENSKFLSQANMEKTIKENWRNESWAISSNSTPFVERQCIPKMRSWSPCPETNSPSQSTPFISTSNCILRTPDSKIYSPKSLVFTSPISSMDPTSHDTSFSKSRTGTILYSTCDSSVLRTPKRPSASSPGTIQAHMVSSTSDKDLFHSFSHVESAMMDVSVQCEFPSLSDELVRELMRKLYKCAEWPQHFYVWLKRLVERFRIWWHSITPGPCDCSERLMDIEAKLKALEAEIDKLNRKQDNDLVNAKLMELEGDHEVISSPNVPCCAPPPPPPPPPPLETPSVLTIKPSTSRLNQILQTPVHAPRPAITAQELQSVRLRKVSERSVSSASVGNKRVGPMVTMDQLRTVKLRPRRKPQSQPQSPTRTPLSQDRMGRLRSPGYRKERRPRIDRIPLSVILNMHEP